jgi:aldehyde:ferredoxin oxidoreductase
MKRLHRPEIKMNGLDVVIIEGGLPVYLGVVDERVEIKFSGIVVEGINCFSMGAIIRVKCDRDICGGRRVLVVEL